MAVCSTCITGRMRLATMRTSRTTNLWPLRSKSSTTARGWTLRHRRAPVRGAGPCSTRGSTARAVRSRPGRSWRIGAANPGARCVRSSYSGSVSRTSCRYVAACSAWKPNSSDPNAGRPANNSGDAGGRSAGIGAASKPSSAGADGEAEGNDAAAVAHVSPRGSYNVSVNPSPSSTASTVISSPS